MRLPTSVSEQQPGQAPPASLVARLMAAWARITGGEAAAERRPSSRHYSSRGLPIPMSKSAVAPWVRDLTRLIDRHAAAGEHIGHLRLVEQALRMPGGSLDQVPQSMLKTAAWELRSLVRHSTPSPALARLLDHFEHQLFRDEMAHGAREAHDRAAAARSAEASRN